MTSPAQLKYLDALGIPVWVSRDLIIERDDIIEIPDHSSDTGTSSTSYSDSSAKSHSSAEPKNSALSILSSIDDSSAFRQSRQSPHNPETTNSNLTVDTKSTLDDVVADSIDRSKLGEEPLKNIINPGTETKNTINLLFQSPNHYVYASGSEAADWMVIGHSPEPFNGIGQEPFASESGELLNNMLRAVGIEQPRVQAYLLNVIDVNKSLDSNAEIQQQLKDKLLSVIEKIKPKVILLVGQNAAQNLLSLDDPLIIMRSKVHKITESNIPCIVTYYPSYLLHKTTDKRKAWNDLKLAMSQLN